MFSQIKWEVMRRSANRGLIMKIHKIDHSIKGNSVNAIWINEIFLNPHIYMYIYPTWKNSTYIWDAMAVLIYVYIV